MPIRGWWLIVEMWVPFVYIWTTAYELSQVNVCYLRVTTPQRFIPVSYNWQCQFAFLTQRIIYFTFYFYINRIQYFSLFPIAFVFIQNVNYTFAVILQLFWNSKSFVNGYRVFTRIAAIWNKMNSVETFVFYPEKY